MLEILTAKSGQPIARIKGTHLHSPYNPEKEAQRFVGQSIPQRNPSTILLLGAGLGYIYREITRSFPSAAVLLVFYHQALWKSFSSLLPPGTYWHPGENETVLQFLRSRIHELEAEGLAVVEWPASARAFPEASLSANRALHQLFRELRGTLVTTAALGRLWLRNSLANFLGIDEIFPPASGEPGRGPTIIAAPGPSLAEGIDSLAPYRELIELWALPSSLEFLLSRNLTPDTVVLTDPSYYAFSHLQCAKDRRLHLTMPLSAARGVWRISARISLVNQDTPAERILLEQAGVSAPTVPAQGTVAATALLLALGRRKDPVIFAGLDFCYRDIISHVRPNNFETWLALKSNRLNSLHHQLFALAAERAPAGHGGERRGLALDTYAGWFREAGKDSAWRKRIYRLHPSEIDLPGIDNIADTKLERLILGGKAGGKSGSKRASRDGFPPPLKPYPSRERRREIVSVLLADWIEGVQRLIAAIGSSGTLEPLMRDSSGLSLLYLCNAAELTEARRIFRLRGQEAGVSKIKDLLENHGDFLRGLSREVSGNG